MRHHRAVHHFRFHRGPARRRGPVRQDKMQELRCDSCGNRVLVEKFSPTHTVLPTDTTHCEPVPGRLGDRIAERR